MNMINYPASITKIMTALITLEKCSLDEIVTYSYYATHSIEANSSTIGTTEGEELTVEESLYALLLESANECGNGLAEHVSGSIEAFVDQMNEKAEELGCTNTHFTNPHGLPDETHYTSAYDMALITREALKYDEFVRISGSERYQMRSTNKDDNITYMTNHHKMIASNNGIDSFLDSTVIAGKTGYTSKAQNTLVTVAERNGLTLVVVTMRTESSSVPGVPLYSDTALLLDYASENFKIVNVAENETAIPDINFDNFFSNPYKGATAQSVLISQQDNIVLPVDIDFSEVTCRLVFDEGEMGNGIIAHLCYTYQQIPVGTASIKVEQMEDVDSSDYINKRFVYINLRLLLVPLIFLALILVGIFIIRIKRRKRMRLFHLQNKRRRYKSKKYQKRHHQAKLHQKKDL